MASTMCNMGYVAIELGDFNDVDSDGEEDDQLRNLSEPKRQKVVDAREQIKAGMGNDTGYWDNAVVHQQGESSN